MMKKQSKKVLICAPNLNFGGAERMSLELLDVLSNGEFEVTMYIQEKIQNQYTPTDEQLTKIIYGFKAEYKRIHLFKHLFNVVTLSRNMDIVIGACEGRASAIALIAAMINRIPLAVWIHCNWSYFSKTMSWRTKLSMLTFNKANAIISPTKGVAESHGENFPNQKHLLRVIPNCIDIENIKALAKCEISTEYTHIFNKPTVIAVGRLNHQKGFDLLLQSHKIASLSGSNHNLIILGSGTDKSKLEKLAVDLNIQDSVFFIPFQSNPFAYIAKATLFVLSSRYEGFGLVITEALTCHTPVISFDCPSGPSEILEDGKYGILVPSEDVNKMAEEISRLLSDEKERNRLSSIGLVRAEQFGRKNFSNAWTKTINDLTN